MTQRMASQTLLIPVLALVALGAPVAYTAAMGMHGMAPWMGMGQDPGYAPSMMNSSGWGMGWDHCPHHEEAEAYWAAAETTTVTGTIVAKDEYRLLLVVDTGDTTITVKLPGMMVDESNGYLVSSHWLIEKIDTGTQVELELLPNNMATAITIDTTTYTAPMKAH